LSQVYQFTVEGTCSVPLASFRYFCFDCTFLDSIKFLKNCSSKWAYCRRKKSRAYWRSLLKLFRLRPGHLVVVSC